MIHPPALSVHAVIAVLTVFVPQLMHSLKQDDVAALYAQAQDRAAYIMNTGDTREIEALAQSQSGIDLINIARSSMASAEESRMIAAARHAQGAFMNSAQGALTDSNLSDQDAETILAVLQSPAR